MKFISIPIALVLSFAVLVAASPLEKKSCTTIICAEETVQICCADYGSEGLCENSTCYCGVGCI
ncbi:hypothetical protein ASPZODRAFT_132530 [Penicilliopsis zonata CBS 506.65]|uniref:Invertebrate defensins family profile domain-containing protein n=1 Tax=Penicilliopsis zonata CBS 506.65 TaxID=1073090 RepID=A0A1L9SGN7_9EURO|nr:hypothetical protein ASPZODRAFT_132530 [Penicilliopsis zonata CBS 506.65]OJJ46435.1 hypothetical protein ASPZODRAFT_132530 [Penicilliopsis zonata CBS 506.65]